jgi:hypothetical protein
LDPPSNQRPPPLSSSSRPPSTAARSPSRPHTRTSFEARLPLSSCAAVASNWSSTAPGMTPLSHHNPRPLSASTRQQVVGGTGGGDAGRSGGGGKS